MSCSSETSLLLGTLLSDERSDVGAGETSSAHVVEGLSVLGTSKEQGVGAYL